MTVLFGAAQAVRSIKSEALANHAGKAPKVHLKRDGLYLHWSATMMTAQRAEAWVGRADQARACRRKHKAAAGCVIRKVLSIPQPDMVIQ
ncbi:hypothetical protein WH87_04945 [Devosia epidermidihirudinis]|uniref:Uncharacterized protein n=1 Tax=Devosia epidermidihirudinis TaxID=1293439 RepID=A0A0F5QFP0_9HYPH|nr:hypothetical protein [Devosia epidermidihirudinis]KKC39541.1 hypothetical protein WH87_04945 [Devosia epidermidihirudinis]